MLSERRGSKMGYVLERLNGRAEVVSLDKISMSNRTRQDMGDIKALALSLKEMGQLQNLVLYEDPLGGCYNLLAGGRRYIAMTEELGWTEANCLIFERELSPRELLEIEFEENNNRKSFHWKEDVDIKARIFELRQQELGVKTSTAADAKGTSIRDTAQDLGISHATLSVDVALSKASDRTPQLFEGCTTKKEAVRAMRTAGEVMLRAELAKRMMAYETTKIASGDYSVSKIKSLADRFIISDCFEGMKAIPDGTINMVEIDPPYAIELQRLKKGQQFGLSEYNEQIYSDYVSFLQGLFKEAYRVMSPNSWIICWFAPDPWFEVVFTLLEAAGFKATRLTGKWVKPIGQTHNPNRQLANACEEFFYGSKGEPALAQAGRTNVFPFHPVSANKKYHPTQRPLELMTELLRTFCWEGDRILVPFLGSGITLLAAETLKMSAFGFELEQSYKDGFLFAASEMFA
jgi:site-specific DNA-methyltransferase (adenine-specific)